MKVDQNENQTDGFRELCATIQQNTKEISDLKSNVNKFGKNGLKAVHYLLSKDSERILLGVLGVLRKDITKGIFVVRPIII